MEKNVMRTIENKLVILPHSVKNESDGGVYLPDSYVENQKTNAGEVLFAGPGLMKEDGTLKPMSVKVGDIVVYPQHAGADMKVGDTLYRVMRDSDIHLILSSKDE
jgi:chaperonin GroES